MKSSTAAARWECRYLLYRGHLSTSIRLCEAGVLDRHNNMSAFFVEIIGRETGQVLPDRFYSARKSSLLAFNSGTSCVFCALSLADSKVKELQCADDSNVLTNCSSGLWKEGDSRERKRWKWPRKLEVPCDFLQTISFPGLYLYWTVL